MPSHNLSTIFATAYVVMSYFVAHSCAYFVVMSPGEGVAWREGVANSVSWRKGVLDGISSFDIEMNRIGGDGVHLIARNVPATSTSLNVFLQDVTPADDYFLLFVNSTHGVLHTTSRKFSVIPSSASPPSGTSLSSPDPKAPTVTISGSPNPTQGFATTYPALPNTSIRLSDSLLLKYVWSLCGILFGYLFGIFWTLW